MWARPVLLGEDVPSSWMAAESLARLGDRERVESAVVALEQADKRFSRLATDGPETLKESPRWT
jgi:hypothetical protein